MVLVLCLLIIMWMSLSFFFSSCLFWLVKCLVMVDMMSNFRFISIVVDVMVNKVVRWIVSEC